MENRDNILNELKEIAPELAKLEKKTFDQVPAGYFAQFSDVMIKKIQHQELAEQAPALAQVEKANTFDAPADYFKRFPDQMLGRVSAGQKPLRTSATVWKQSLNRILDTVAGVIFKPKYSFALAGTASLIIVGMMLLIKVEQCNDLDCKMASITDEELNTYLDSNADLLPDEVFEATFDDKSNSDQIFKETLNEISDEELSDAILD